MLSLMWLRTLVNHQYRNGGSTSSAFRTLWAVRVKFNISFISVHAFSVASLSSPGSCLKRAGTMQEGGIVRFYRGLGPALIQGPMSRFGDTAANAGTLALLDSYDATSNMAVRHLCAVKMCCTRIHRMGGVTQLDV